MIITEIIEINGAQYRRTYSDAGRMIELDGVAYNEAIDPLTVVRAYEEGAPTGEDPRAIARAEFIDGLMEEFINDR